MGTQNFRAADIKGFSPAVEPTRTEDLYALNGRNYVFDTKGPRSIFGNRLLLPHKLGKPSHTQGFRIRLRNGDRIFTFTGDAIMEWSESSGGWRMIYLTPDTSVSPYRWTWGYLNNKVFFCHPRTGILVYDVESGICIPHNGPGVPTEVLSIVINNGFLCAVGPELFSWSAPSDGMNFEPTLGGAGFQQISDRVPGYPIMVTSYTRGCLTWTTGGVMRSEFTGDSAVYRHRALQTEYRPVNSFCTCRVDDDTVVILDERGLFQSKGEAPTPFAPLFNEFLQQYIQDNDLRVGENVRVEWDELQRLMYISTSLSYSNALYENCFVLYPNLDKWGQFNEDHYGIIPIRIEDSDRADDYYGFVDSDGRVRYWQNTGSREVRPEDTDGTKLGANLYYPVIQKPVTYEEGAEGSVLSSSMILNTIPTIEMTQPAAFYVPDGLTPMASERMGLDAKIMIGLFRPNGQTANDELSEIVNVLVRSLEGDNASVGTGYNITPPTPNMDGGDLNQGFESVDFNFDDETHYVNHTLRIIGTLDGRTEFMSAEPELVGFVRGARYYACGVVGLWHIIELTAVEVGESFHPVTFEMTATTAGRLL